MPSDTFATQWMRTFKSELELKSQSYELTFNKIQLDLSEIEKSIEQLDLKSEWSMRQTILLLIKRDRAERKLTLLKKEYMIDLSKIRYKKGVEMIKMIYEKILGLDHHFTSLKTYQNVASISNPNSYPEFQKMKAQLHENLDKKQNIPLPNIFDSNPFVSLTMSLVSSVFGDGEKVKRTEDLEEISCILEFTVRMSADLNVIYYETEFLKKNNLSLKQDCIELFKDYTKILDYHVSLQECRKEDEWEDVFEALDLFSEEFNNEKKDPNMAKKAYKRQIDLEFSVERLLRFLEIYNNFINQGEKYYEKFATIVNNYSNEAACATKLPNQLSILKSDIEMSISKFKEAYNITDLRGSKLKDLMYGISD